MILIRKLFRIREFIGVKPYYSIKNLVNDKVTNAALVVCPIDIHYALSIYLSENKIHQLIETSMCSTVEQGRLMVEKAAENKVVMRIAENFLRFPFDRIAKEINKTGFIGEVKRIVCYHDHTGYHNNSRWTHFFDEYPESVQCIDHLDANTPSQFNGPSSPHFGEFHLQVFQIPKQ